MTISPSKQYENKVMINILYVGNNVVKVTSGYDRLNMRNLLLLKQLPDVEVDLLEFQQYTIWDKIFLHIGGTSFALVKKIIEKCSAKDYDFIFFSSSLQGPVIKQVKLRYPTLKVICNFHNIEKQYAKEFLRVSGIRHLPFYCSAIISEAKAVKHIDYSLVLNSRDEEYLWKYYRKHADLILPITVDDCFDIKKALTCKSAGNNVVYLFVGVAFYANVEGIRWFVKNILPHIIGKLVIVGKGMDAYKSEFSSDRVEVYGYVDDLAQFYYQASFVVSPILSGGGMKTKIAEALMYGKTVIGTKEALEGYIIEKKAIYQCNSASQFIDTIKYLHNTDNTALYNPISRKLYEEEYSNDSIFDKLKAAISAWKNQ